MVAKPMAPSSSIHEVKKNCNKLWEFVLHFPPLTEVSSNVSFFSCFTVEMYFFYFNLTSQFDNIPSDWLVIGHWAMHWKLSTSSTHLVPGPPNILFLFSFVHSPTTEPPSMDPGYSPLPLRQPNLPLGLDELFTSDQARYSNLSTGNLLGPSKTMSLHGPSNKKKIAPLPPGPKTPPTPPKKAPLKLPVEKS